MDEYDMFVANWTEEEKRILDEMRAQFEQEASTPPSVPRCECGAAACGYTKPSRHHYEWCKFYAEQGN